MNNLLPKLSEKVTKVEESKLAFWNPSAADPAKATISHVLQREFTVDVELFYKRKENALPKSEPNYVSSGEIERLGPSEISEENRGTPDDPVISTKMFSDARKEELTSRPRPPKIIRDEAAKVLRVKIFNQLKYRHIDLFLQCNSSRLFNTTLTPFKYLSRILDGKPQPSTVESLPSIASSTSSPRAISPSSSAANRKRESSVISPPDPSRSVVEEKEGELLYILCSSTSRATITTTNRQEIKDYRFFANQRIGLEVEAAHQRLVVSKVLPETQAAAFEKFLDGAEIIAINAERVVDLEEFQSAMLRAKKGVFITLTIASFREGRQKIDDLYLQNLTKSNQMKSLFSNLMNSSETQRTHSGSNPRRSSMLFSNSDDDDSHNGNEDEDGRSSPNSPTVSRQGTPSNRSASHSSFNRQHTSQSQQLSQRGNSAASSPTTGRGRLESRDKKSRSRDKEDDSTSTSSSFHLSRKWSKKHTQTSSTSFTSSPPSSPPHHQSFKQEQKSHVEEDNVELQEEEEVQEGEEERFDEGEGENDVMLAAKTTVIRGEEELSLHENSDPSLPIAAPLNIPDDNNDDDNSSHDDWNALTRVETAEAPTVFPFTSLVCMPSPYLRASHHWGNPRFYLQFSNFSSQWKMELNWVDESGVLIPRGEKDLLQGDTHFELFSAAHVWAVIATPLKTGLGGGANSSKASINTSLVVNRASLSESVSGTNAGPQLESLQSTSGSIAGRAQTTEESQMIFVFRPSKACCLQESKCLSVLWSPGNALTISHLLYSKSMKQAITSSHDKHKEDRIKPSIHIQLFETKSATSSLPPPPLTSSSTLHPPLPRDYEAEREMEKEELGKLTRKPLRSGRALSKIHTSQRPHNHQKIAVKKPPPSNPNLNPSPDLPY